MLEIAGDVSNPEGRRHWWLAALQAAASLEPTVTTIPLLDALVAEAELEWLAAVPGAHSGLLLRGVGPIMGSGAQTELSRLIQVREALNCDVLSRVGVLASFGDRRTPLLNLGDPRMAWIEDPPLLDTRLAHVGGGGYALLAGGLGDRKRAAELVSKWDAVYSATGCIARLAVD